MTTDLKALARPHTGEMNKQESAFADWLEAQKRAGEILWYKYEPFTFRLGNRTSYTSDFIAIRADAHIVAYEIKGYWTGRHQHSRVKIKVAAAMFPWIHFVGVQKKPKKDGGGWEFEEFKP